jgi:hypothetical protein
MNDERGTMNQRPVLSVVPFIIHHSSFIVPVVVALVGTFWLSWPRVGHWATPEEMQQARWRQPHLLTRHFYYGTRFWFRTEGDLARLPAAAELTLHADDHYAVWLNDRLLRVDYGDRFRSQHGGYFQVGAQPVNLRPYLRPGRNVLAVETDQASCQPPYGLAWELQPPQPEVAALRQQWSAHWQATTRPPLPGWQTGQGAGDDWRPPLAATRTVDVDRFSAPVQRVYLRPSQYRQPCAWPGMALLLALYVVGSSWYLYRALGRENEERRLQSGEDDKA